MFSAGMCTMHTWIRLRWCSSSVMTDSVKPTIACLAPQYAACSGMPRNASALPTWMTTPVPRGPM